MCVCILWSPNELCPKKFELKTRSLKEREITLRRHFVYASLWFKYFFCYVSDLIFDVTYSAAVAPGFLHWGIKCYLTSPYILHLFWGDFTPLYIFTF